MTTLSISLQITLIPLPDARMQLLLQLQNTQEEALENWRLHFDLPKLIEAGGGTQILDQTGSHWVVACDRANPLAPGESIELEFFAETPIIQRVSDIPNGFYLLSENGLHSVELASHNLRAALTDQQAANSATPPRPMVTSELPHLLPRPEQVRMTSGHFPCPDIWSAYASDIIQAVLADFSRFTGNELRTKSVNEPAEAQLVLSADPALPDEGYRLRIQATAVHIEASSAAGHFYGLVSLQQLAEVHTGKIPCGTIEDTPRFSHRGLMLDCARHFHSTAAIKTLLDEMARFKLNRFHWHLTDDEGWRVEIKRYPQLTDVGAWRGEGEALASQFGSGAERYGGYYSQDDVREIVAYAAARQITVIPEIDIPGHSRAAIKALPHLLQESGDQSRYLSVQLYRDNVLNPALPGTYEFLEGVLDEVCTLFPSPWIHLGADEVPEGVWVDSPACQTMLSQHGYEKPLDLQGHLLRHVQDYLRGKGKQFMGWEEAAHGDKLAHDAVICAWTSADSAQRTAAMGYPVIACAAQHTYLDLAWDKSINEPGLYWAGTADLQTCYEYEPEGKDSATAQAVVGVQAQLWSELLSSEQRLQYMAFPRLLAVAENAWSPAEGKNWPGFADRLNRQLPLLAQRGIGYRKG